MSLSTLFSRLPIVGSRSRIRWLRQTRPHNCTQTVLAMALGLPIESVEQAAGTHDTLTVHETMSLLNRFGIFCRPVSAKLVAQFWPMYYRQGGGRRLRGLAFELPDTARGRSLGHAYFIFGPNAYDPATGETMPLDQATLERLDWLVLIPPDVYDANALESLRNAMVGVA